MSVARGALGIELGSTRIKACLIGEGHEVLATGSHEWENAYVDRRWTYSTDAVWEGLRAAVAGLIADATQRYGQAPEITAIGVSAMMHGYLPFDAAGELLVPFRTWRNTSTGPAAAELTDLLGYNIPMRWSIAHLYQAVLDGEEHVGQVAFLTTLAGYVHWQLTGRRVLGVGDASGMFPLDPTTGSYDAALLDRFDAHLAALGADLPALGALLPAAVPAGGDAGVLTADGTLRLDPSGVLRPGLPVAPPEGDAGTGMVATNAIAPRTGNVSVGTSIFAMIVLEQPMSSVHHEIDLVTTPVGDLVAMVHCNNGASELGEWAEVFHDFAGAIGSTATRDDVFAALLARSLEGAADAGGVLAYNYLAGEPVTGLTEGRPLVVRTPDSDLSLANLMRANVYGVFATLSLGMRILTAEGVEVDSLLAHGGLFRTAGVAQRFLAAAVNTPITVAETASEGGAWGMAVLAAFRAAAAAHADTPDGAFPTLAEYLTTRVFADAETTTLAPQPEDVAGYAAYLSRYEAGLPIEAAAASAI